MALLTRHPNGPSVRAQVREQCAVVTSAQSQMISEAKAALTASITDASGAISQVVRQASAGVAAPLVVKAPPFAAFPSTPVPSAAAVPPPAPPAASNGGGSSVAADFALTMQLQQMIAAAQYEQAFTQALGASNLDLLL